MKTIPLTKLTYHLEHNHAEEGDEYTITDKGVLTWKQDGEELFVVTVQADPNDIREVIAFYFNEGPCLELRELP